METTQKIVHPDPVIHLATGTYPGCILSHMVHIREATLDDIPDAADTLSFAFSDYAWTNWTVAPDRHVDRIRDIQRVWNTLPCHAGLSTSRTPLLLSSPSSALKLTGVSPQTHGSASSQPPATRRLTALRYHSRSLPSQEAGNWPP